MNFERLGQYRYRIPREGKMQVEAAFYASEKILSDLAAEDYASLRQLQNVATLPGIVEPALTMPDIHWGYGFPIGGVAAFDPQEGGVVSPGGIGFDINCGVRLLTSDIERTELERRKDRLADALYEAVPRGWAGAARTSHEQTGARGDPGRRTRPAGRARVRRGGGPGTHRVGREAFGRGPRCGLREGVRAGVAAARDPGLRQPLPRGPVRGRDLRRGSR